MDDRERADVLVDDLSAIITDAIAEVLGDKWEGCSFDATDARNRAAAEFAKVRQEGYAAGQAEMREIAAREVKEWSGSSVFAFRVRALPLAPLPVKDGGA